MTRPLVGGVVVGLAALALTGWVVAGGAGAFAGFAAVQAWQRRRRVAGRRRSRPGSRRWRRGVSSCATCCRLSMGSSARSWRRRGPAPTRSARRSGALAARLGRQRPETAVREFAAEVDDPSGDLVASVLLLAMTRSSRTSELLSELAVTIRERAAMRLRVEADRAGQRSEARFIVAFSAVFIGGIAIFGRGSDFLDAYDTVTGQLVLGAGRRACSRWGSAG